MLRNLLSEVFKIKARARTHTHTGWWKFGELEKI